MKNLTHRGLVQPQDIGQTLTAPEKNLKAGMKITPLPINEVRIPTCVEKRFG